MANIYSFSHTSNQQLFIEPLQGAKSHARCLRYSSFLPPWSVKPVKEADKYISQFSALMILVTNEFLVDYRNEHLSFCSWVSSSTGGKKVLKRGSFPSCSWRVWFGSAWHVCQLAHALLKADSRRTQAKLCSTFKASAHITFADILLASKWRSQAHHQWGKEIYSASSSGR